MSEQSLPPVSQPIALFDQFVAGVPQTLILKEKVLSVSGDSFDITLDNGQPILKVEGAWVSIHGRKKVSDMNGQHLFNIIKEHMHIHTTYAVEDPENKKIAEVKSGFKCKLHISNWQRRILLIPLVIGSKAAATFTDRRGRAVTLTMKSGILDRSADIVDQDSGQTVAHITRKGLNARNLLFHQDTYAVVVAPGVDAALIAALCICFDEKNRDEK